MRNSLLAVGGLVLVLMAAVGWQPARTAAQSPDASAVFVGPLEDGDLLAMVGVHVDAPDATGQRRVRAYACDGLVPGLAVWFTGFIGAGDDQRARLRSAGGSEELELHVSGQQIEGAFIDAAGIAHPFFAVPAFDGAGIYDVTVHPDGAYVGVSTTGDTIDARITGGGVTGVINTTDGRSLEFANKILAQQPPEALTEAGLPVTFADLPVKELVPESYVAVVSPGGFYFFGRSGDIRAGFPGVFIIGLDMNDSRPVGGLTAVFEPRIAP